MKLAAFVAVLAASPLAGLALSTMQPEVFPIKPVQGDVGEPLYLTEYINRGDIAGAKAASLVSEPLEGLSSSQQPESYSGFFTVNETIDGNMFFWFFPATEADPEDAPVVIWLQGGPGSSSLFGLFEIHGPISAVDDENGDVTGVPNEYTWARKANMLYIDNPVGAGYSYADNDGLPTEQGQVGENLYEMLTQFFTVFPEYLPNEFFAFGESYAGKWVPTIGRKISEENDAGAEIQINLAGLGIGDGFMSPEEQATYGDYLFQASLVDEPTRDELLDLEGQVQAACAAEDWEAALALWNVEFNVFLGAMGCFYYYEIRQCRTDPEENNYADYVTLDSTRLAIHVGDRPFGSQSGAVYNSMSNDFMQSARDDVLYLLERFPVLIYDGNMDIICNHSGILKMLANFNTWSAYDDYVDADREVFKADNGETAGYLTSAGNLRLFVMRNAGHMVPRSQPAFALEMFSLFVDGDL